jgi:hypothetical protein
MAKQISDPSRPTATEIQSNDYFVLDRGENGVTYRVPAPLLTNVQEFTFDVTILYTIIVPTSIQGQMIYGTTPYATDGEIDIYCGGTRQVWGFPADDGFLFGTVSRVVNAFVSVTSTSTDTQYVANQPLTIKTVGANPTAGDSDIRIFGTYKVIDIS